MGIAVKVSPRQLAVTLETNGPSRIMKRRFYYTDFSAAATTAHNDTIILPAGVRVRGAFISLITAFAGGSVSACTLSAGTTGSATTYLGATNVFTGATVLGNVTVAAGAGLGGFASGNATPTVAGIVRLDLVTTTANTSTLTAGVVDFYLELQAVDVRIS